MEEGRARKKPLSVKQMFEELRRRKSVDSAKLESASELADDRSARPQCNSARGMVSILGQNISIKPNMKKIDGQLNRPPHFSVQTRGVKHSLEGKLMTEVESFDIRNEYLRDPSIKNQHFESDQLSVHSLKRILEPGPKNWPPAQN